VHAHIAETDIDNFDRIMNINARGSLLCERAQVAAMLEQEPKTWTRRNGTRDIGRGVIVNIGSANSYVGLPNKGSYTIWKHAFMATTKMAGRIHQCPQPPSNPLLECHH
jgi:NAD(P)-dependent dehydrogenase (short-subunit alcohol dehydrogenase family)